MCHVLFVPGGQTFYVGGGGTYDDVVEELVVSEANFLVSEVSKLSAGARIFRDPYGPTNSSMLYFCNKNHIKGL